MSNNAVIEIKEIVPDLESMALQEKSKVRSLIFVLPDTAFRMLDSVWPDRPHPTNNTA